MRSHGIREAREQKVEGKECRGRVGQGTCAARGPSFECREADDKPKSEVARTFATYRSNTQIPYVQFTYDNLQRERP
jgi:hypothetical protein